MGATAAAEWRIWSRRCRRGRGAVGKHRHADGDERSRKSGALSHPPEETGTPVLVGAAVMLQLIGCNPLVLMAAWSPSSRSVNSNSRWTSVTLLDPPCSIHLIEKCCRSHRVELSREQCIAGHQIVQAVLVIEHTRHGRVRIVPINAVQGCPLRRRSEASCDVKGDAIRSRRGLDQSLEHHLIGGSSEPEPPDYSRVLNISGKNARYCLPREGPPRRTIIDWKLVSPNRHPTLNGAGNPLTKLRS